MSIQVTHMLHGHRVPCDFAFAKSFCTHMCSAVSGLSQWKIKRKSQEIENWKVIAIFPRHTSTMLGMIRRVRESVLMILSMIGEITLEMTV